jgi:hypothetical protein
VAELAAGQQASAASVQWSRVGPGWLLIETKPTEPAADLRFRVTK